MGQHQQQNFLVSSSVIIPRSLDLRPAGQTTAVSLRGGAGHQHPRSTLLPLARARSVAGGGRLRSAQASSTRARTPATPGGPGPLLTGRRPGRWGTIPPQAVSRRLVRPLPPRPTNVSNLPVPVAPLHNLRTLRYPVHRSRDGDRVANIARLLTRQRARLQRLHGQKLRRQLRRSRALGCGPGNFPPAPACRKPWVRIDLTLTLDQTARACTRALARARARVFAGRRRRHPRPHIDVYA